MTSSRKVNDNLIDVFNEAVDIGDTKKAEELATLVNPDLALDAQKLVCHASVVKILLNRNPSSEALNRFFKMAVCAGPYEEVISLLLERDDVQVSYRPDQFNAVSHAVEFQYPPEIIFLLAHHTKSEIERTRALVRFVENKKHHMEYGAFEGNLEKKKAFQQYALAVIKELFGPWNEPIVDLYAKNKNGVSVLELAQKGKDLELVAEQIQEWHKRYPQFRTGYRLYSAAMGQNLAELELLLSLGMDINSRPYGKTALYAATERGNHEIVAFLLAHNADANIVDHDGRLPLHIAPSFLSAETTELLIKHTKDLNRVDVGRVGAQSTTPLMRAVEANRLDIVTLLLKYGADVYRANDSGNTVFDIINQSAKSAIRSVNAEIINFLHQHAKKVDALKNTQANNISATSPRSFSIWASTQGIDGNTVAEREINMTPS